MSKLVEGIRNARTSFEKTLEAGLGMFPGNLVITDLKQQYRAALMIEKSGEESGRDTNDEGRDVSKDTVGEVSGKATNDEGRDVSKETVGDVSGKGNNEEGTNASNEDPFESPGFAMGLQTQLEVFKSSDKACEDFYVLKKKNGNGSTKFQPGVYTRPVVGNAERGGRKWSNDKIGGKKWVNKES